VGFYRRAGVCQVCPDRTYVFLAFFITLYVVSLLTYYLIARGMHVWTLGEICIDYGQVLSLFWRFGVSWSPAVTRLIMGASVTNLNLELVAPECVVPNVNFSGRWFAAELLPVITAAVLLGCFVLNELVKPLVLSCVLAGYRVPSWRKASGRYLATFVFFFRLLFVYMSRNSLDAFNCRPTNPSTDGVQYLGGDLSVVCYQPGSPQMAILPAAIAGVVVYIIVLPLLALYYMKKHRSTMTADVFAAARGIELSKLKNGSDSDRQFRKTMYALYIHFKPSLWWWDYVITSRKLLIVFTTLMFNRTPTFQQGCALIILLLALAIHLRKTPYMSPSNDLKLLQRDDQDVLQQTATEMLRMAELSAARQRALAADKLGIGSLIGESREESRAVEAAEQRKLRKAMLKVTALQVIVTGPALVRCTLLLDLPWTKFLLDANIVEASLLGSLATLVIFGIMQGSALFQGANLDRFYAAQQWELSWTAFTLCLATLAYIAAVLALDAALTVAPDRVREALSACCVRCTRVDRGVAKLREAQKSLRRITPGAVPAAGAGTLRPADLSSYNNNAPALSVAKGKLAPGVPAVVPGLRSVPGVPGVASVVRSVDFSADGDVGFAQFNPLSAAGAGGSGSFAQAASARASTLAVQPGQRVQILGRSKSGRHQKLKFAPVASQTGPQ
jgi:hypothetical protein